MSSNHQEKIDKFNDDLFSENFLSQSSGKKFNLRSFIIVLFGFWIFFMTTKNSALFTIIYGPQLQKYFELIMMLGIFCLFFYKTFNKKQLIPLTVVLVLVVANFIIVGNDYTDLLPLSFLIVFQNNGKDLNRLVKSAVIGYICSISIILLFYTLGFLPNNVQIRLDVVRNSFGFNLPIHLPATIFSLVSTIIFYFKKKMNILLLIGLSILVLIVNEFTDGRTYLLTFMFILGGLLLKKVISSKKYSKLLFFVAVTNYTSGLFLSVYGAFNFWNSQSLMRVNEILTGRVWWWAKYIENYSIGLLPQSIIRGSEGGTKWILDNAYLTLLLENGLLIFIIFTLILFLTLHKLMKENDYISLILWNAWLLTFISGNNGLMVSKNILLLQIGSLLWTEKSKILSVIQK